MAEEQHTAQTESKRPAQRTGLFSNIVAIIGFIILIVIIVWGLVHIASLSNGWFSSLFGSRGPSIAVTAPANATSGQPLTISWNYSTSDKGNFAFLYQCRTGLHFETPGPTGIANNVPCGAAFTLPATIKQLSVTPYLTGTSSSTVPVTILFLPSATSSKQAQGTTSITVHLAAAVQNGGTTVIPFPVPVTPGGVTPVPAPAPTPKPSPAPALGPADLSVRITSVNVDPSGNGTVTFDIANIGARASGTYYFTAQLPTYGGYTYNSPSQVSLAPQAHVVSTLTFGPATAGTVTVTVQSVASETNTANNTASQSVNAPYPYPQPYYNNQPYPYNQY